MGLAAIDPHSQKEQGHTFLSGAGQKTHEFFVYASSNEK